MVYHDNNRSMVASMIMLLLMLFALMGVLLLMYFTLTIDPHKLPIQPVTAPINRVLPPPPSSSEECSGDSCDLNSTRSYLILAASSTLLAPASWKGGQRDCTV